MSRVAVATVVYPNANIASVPSDGEATISLNNPKPLADIDPIVDNTGIIIP